MKIQELLSDYTMMIRVYLDLAVNKFFSIDVNKDNFSDKAFFVLIEEPVYSIISKYTKDNYNWKNIHDEAEYLGNYYSPNRKNRSLEFMKKRGFPVNGLEEKIANLKGIGKDEFYVTYFKYPEVPEIFNKLFDNISFMVLGQANKVEFTF